MSAMPAGPGLKGKSLSVAAPRGKSSTTDTPKETIRFKRQNRSSQTSLVLSGESQADSSGPPGLTPQPKVKSYLCFPESTKVTCPFGSQCQYCHDYCCRASQSHVSHRCAQHINW